jgi:hypothetical protein
LLAGGRRVRSRQSRLGRMKPRSRLIEPFGFLFSPFIVWRSNY